jgi:predicted ATPase
MEEIEIKNVGPIKEANLTLNKINVFMGPQSSGKSTIAKIISYCTWVEKDVATSQSLDNYNDNDNFKKQLEKYHKMNEYFQSNSYISYKSDIVEMEYKAGNFSIKWKNRYAYKRSKISYIPSERNMITLPEVKKVEFGDTNIRSFLFDWSDARKNYTESELPLLNLGVNYYYNENENEGHIVKHQNGNSYDILLSNASSGLQSITPLLAMIDYLTFRIYNQEESISFELNTRKRQVYQILLKEFILKEYYKNSNKTEKEQLDEFREKMRANNDEKLNKLLDDADYIVKNLFSTYNSQFIIEEPEQNLFPETQRDLIYYLLEKCLDKEREHRLTITTHSPYILYALNNCMMGELVKNKMVNVSEEEKIKCTNSLINPKCVSIYEIHDEKLKRIQQEDGLISDNYFDTKMKELMNDFYVMLNYYE